MDINGLPTIGFKLVLDRIPNVEFFVQRASLPGMNLGVAEIGTGFVKIPTPGNISYDTFSVSFRVDEDMKAYKEIFDWMVELGHPDDLDQYKNSKSDAKLLILNSKKNPSVAFTYTDAFPVYLSDISFDITMNDIQYVTATAAFRFLRMYHGDPYNIC